MGDTLNLLAKTVIENIAHECTNQGCDRRLSYQEVTRHKEELCKYRMVRCPGENPSPPLMIISKFAKASFRSMQNL